MSRPGGGRGGRGRGGGGRRGGVPEQQPGVPQPYAGGRGRGSAPAQRDLASSSSAPPPAPEPEGLAGEIEKKLVLHSPEPSSKAIRPPRRPGYGTAGRKCAVRANHFLVKVTLEKSICHYDVSVSPEVPTRSLGRAIMKELIEVSGASHMGGRIPVYDGRKSLYTAGPLPFDTKNFKVCLFDKDENTGKVRRERVFNVTIKFASTPDLHHLMQFLSGRHFDMPYETVQAMDVVMRELPTANYTPVGRSYFSRDFGAPSSIGDGLECWKGFYQSIRPAQMGLSMNIDVAATAFYEPSNVIDFVAQLLNGLDPRQPMKDHERVKVKKALRGLRVTTNHSGGKRKYKISDVSSLPLKQLKFPVDESGTMSSVIEYFRGRYKYELQYVNWPCLQVGSDKNHPTYLPMEVCKIVEEQHFSKKLNERQVSNILKVACQRPFERENNIKNVVTLNKYADNKYAREFGISVDNRMASVEARVLPPPELRYGAGPNASCRPGVGVWNMINRKMIDGSEIKSWTCVCFSQTVQRYVDEFVHELVCMCNNMGMRMCQQPCIPFSFGRPEEIERVLRRIGEQSSGRLQLLIIILPERSGLYYGLIKRVCETELDIVSQCCLPKHLRKISKQYLENVALKINVKAGGRNTALTDAVQRKIPLLTDYPTIIFGADVTHPPPGEDTSPSIAAVVASMDWPHVTKYRCLLSAQKHRREIIDDLYTFINEKHGGLIRDHLIAFHRMTGQKPCRIIFYRDGVSEGQFNQVLCSEVDAIHKACQSLESDYLPPVTFIVVQKRHHTRLFPVDHRNRDLTDRSGNILPGTVVDRVICHPTEFDFYLCSHAGIQGTSRPTHYHVLHDENRFTADGLQILTNNLCYTYARCTRSVSIVPPAYYAHLGAARARYYMEGDTSDVGSSLESASRARGGEGRPLPQVKEKVRGVMFYC